MIEMEQVTVQSTDEVTDFQHELISSRRVEGTPVFNTRGEKLGHVHSVMIGKRNGKVAYAVMSFGGFLGMREHVHPVPWELLSYDVDLVGYVVDLTRDQLRGAPAMRLDEADRPQGEDYDAQVSQYYGTMNWWGL
ncbi:PRC-barrel domain-containing protein [Allosphingosinicella vermicomposti]|uniref:PRC-barrel domain-containing protein n=1 Tax=Allosphingosinicella vermicomposti TaxID=614671 RepID=UPI001FE09E60|nr:PRC-barrel domain-containing protein [Allosphingosinicella vermicomposti]